MRIAFFGATDLGYQCCNQLLEMGEEVVGIFSIPQNFRISYAPNGVHNVTFRSFEDMASTHHIPLVYVTKKMGASEYLDVLREWQPDFGLVIGWYYMIPQTVRQLFPKAVGGIHASLLPKYRGGAPLVWAIINGETKAGVSFFYFEDGVDTGDIIAQNTVSITLDDTIKTVYDKVTHASLDLIQTHVPRIRNGTALRLAQNHTEATLFPQRAPEDGMIDWYRLSATQVYNWIRAQTRPYPGAFTVLNGHKVTLWRASLSVLQAQELRPGVIVTPVPETPDACGIGCADGRLIYVHEVEVDGGDTLSGSAFAKAWCSEGTDPICTNSQT